MKIKLYLILFLFTLIILQILFNTCSYNKEKNNKNEDLIKSDTVFIIKHKTDSIRDTIRIVSYKRYPKFVYLKDTLKPYKIDSNNLFSYKLYSDTLRDSNVVIWSKNKVLGELTESNISYKLLVPTKIVDSVFITKNINNTKYSKNVIGLGVITSYNNISPIVKYSYKENNFLLGYNFIDKYPTVGYIRNFKAW